MASEDRVNMETVDMEIQVRTDGDSNSTTITVNAADSDEAVFLKLTEEQLEELVATLIEHRLSHRDRRQPFVQRVMEAVMDGFGVSS